MKLLFLISFFACTTLLFAQKDNAQKNAPISFKVIDASNNPITAHVEIIDAETKQKVKETESSKQGSQVMLQVGNTYFLFFTKSGYLFQSLSLTIPDSAGFQKKLNNIVMEKIDVDKKTILHTVSFDFYQALQIEESSPDLNQVVTLMKDFPKLQIELSGYTDNIGSVTFNTNLSEQRAKAVADVLINKGIDVPRIEYKGYGPTNPLASNFTEEGRLQNNRIELKILKMDLTPLTAKQLKKMKDDLQANKDPKDKNVDLTGNYDKDKDQDTVKIDKPLEVITPDTTRHDSIRIDYKGKFIADKAPLAFSTVNLLTNTGEIVKTTQTDKNGAFQFLNVDGDQDVTIGLNAKETKKYKKIFLADTAGAIVQELSKVNGEFVLALLPSEKKKLETVRVIDIPLKALNLKSKGNKNASLTVKVTDDKGSPIKVEIEATDNLSGESVGKFQTTSDGNCKISLPLGKNYNIVFTKFGYLFQSVNEVVPDSSGYEKNLGNIVLQKVEVGKKVVLNNIFFNSNESTLRKESFAELERAVKLMTTMQSLQIEVSGHTDNVGSAGSNRQLSEQRAKAVVDYLISKGCDKKRLRYKGVGSSQPIASNNTEAGRQLNRRTEFKVLKIDLAEEEIKEAVREKDNPTNTNSNKNSANPIPEHLKKYDLDNNGDISYDEIVSAIDAYFEESASGGAKKDRTIFDLFDYYFDK